MQPNEASARIIIITIFAVLVLTIAGIYLYLKGEPPVQTYSFYVQPTTATTSQAPSVIASHAELYLMPMKLNQTVTEPSTQRFSYFHISFAVPWNETPNVISSTDGAAVQLKFAGGEFITVLAKSPYMELASSVISEAQSQGDVQEIQEAYGGDNLSSDSAWMNLILGTTPNETTTALSARTTLLLLKSAILLSLVNDPSAIYILGGKIRGFVITGQTASANSIITVSHIVIYDDQDIPHDLIVGGGTPDDVSSVIASLSFE